MKGNGRFGRLLFTNEGKTLERNCRNRWPRNTPILQRIAILVSLTALAWLSPPTTWVFASDPQSQVKAPLALEHAENTIEEAEKFNTNYSKAVGTLNDYAIQDLDSKRKGLRNALTTVNADLDRYLKENPKNVDALLLQVRFDLAKYWVFWPETRDDRKRVPGGERDPGKTVDMILQIDPGNAEAYYRKAWMSLSAKPGSEADLSTAIGYVRMAVERAPQNASYREFLASSFYSKGKMAEAAEAVKPLQGGTHPMYLLLLDQEQAPVPDGAIFDNEGTGAASMLAPGDYPQLRARAFLYPGPASKVEEFYRKHWPDFKPQPNPEDVYEAGTGQPANGFAAIFRWKDGALTFSSEAFPKDFMESPAGEPAEKSRLKGALTLWVSESPTLKNGGGGSAWERLPSDFSGERACTIKWINFRAFDKGASPPSSRN